MRSYGVVPEFSFVLGAPPDPIGDMAKTFEFIRQIKRVNPATEIILYTYTPVPMDGALYAEASRLGFAFPATLDEWASDEWRQLMMRRGDGIPWLDGTIRRRVRNFERVLNAFYPTVTDRRLTALRRAVLKAASGWRYALKVYAAPLRAARAAAADALPAAGDDGVLRCTWLIRFAGSRVRQGRSAAASRCRRARATRSGPTPIRRGRTTR